MKLDETISISETKKGYWLYDTTRGMNLSMNAQTKDSAFFEALKYYQRKLLLVEQELKQAKEKLQSIAEVMGLTDYEY